METPRKRINVIVGIILQYKVLLDIRGRVPFGLVLGRKDFGRLFHHVRKGIVRRCILVFLRVLVVIGASIWIWNSIRRTCTGRQ